MPAAERRARRTAHRRMLGCDGLSRAQRFARRMEGREVPNFDLIANPPAWRVAGAAERQELSLVAALLHLRPVVDAELHGPALARLAALVGEGRFDAVCEAEVGNLPLCAGAAELPLPDALHGIGENLLRRADQEPGFAALASLAADMIAATPVQPQSQTA